MTINQQLELGFNGTQSRIPGRRREQRVTRAKWWFAKMRAAVQDAICPPDASQPRPEQIWIPGASRQIRA